VNFTALDRRFNRICFTYHPQDLARGHLLFQRLFRLLERADVLERDDGLVGEGLEQLDLVGRE
jgi:hypothetical protein